MTTPSASPQGHLSASDEMRLRLAENRLREVRQMDLSGTSPAALILAVNRLENALEDVISLAREIHLGQPG